jgi:hypothetical protein
VARQSGAGSAVGLLRDETLGVNPVVGGDARCPSGQEDAVAEDVESGASVHLPHDPLGSGVDVFGAAVVVGAR